MAVEPREIDFSEPRRTLVNEEKLLQSIVENRQAALEVADREWDPAEASVDLVVAIHGLIHAQVAVAEATLYLARITDAKP